MGSEPEVGCLGGRYCTRKVQRVECEMTVELPDLSSREVPKIRLRVNRVTLLLQIPLTTY